jgi:hypothetical protein
MLDDLGILFVDRDVVHDRRAVAEPEPQHVRVQDQVLVRHVDRIAAVDGIAPPLGPGADDRPPGHLRRGERAGGRAAVREVPHRPAVLAIRNDPLAVVERDLVARPVFEHRRQAGHPADAAPFVVEQVALRDLTHGRPAEGRRHRGIESKRCPHLCRLHEHDPLGRIAGREPVHDLAHVGRARGPVLPRLGRGPRSQLAMPVRPLRDRQIGIRTDPAAPCPKQTLRPVEVGQTLTRALAGYRRSYRVGRGHGPPEPSALRLAPR